jgi:hypothetical protein
VHPPIIHLPARSPGPPFPHLCQELKSGRSIPRQKLADAIKAVAQHLIEGGVVPEDARIVKVRGGLPLLLHRGCQAPGLQGDVVCRPRWLRLTAPADWPA